MGARYTPSIEVLQAAVDWELLRAGYWQDSNPDYAEICSRLAKNHQARLHAELKGKPD